MNTNSKITILIILTLTVSNIFAEEINPRKAFLKSALIPGWGELSLGDNSGYFLLCSEILLWSSKFFFQEEEDLLLKESFNYAVAYAQIDPDSDINDTYLYHLTKYNSSGFDAGGYNSYIIEQAESIEDPLERQEFIQDNIYTDELFWNWESKEHRRKYGIKRKDASHYRDYAKAVGGAIIANHILSAINSLRIGSKKRKLALEISYNHKLDPLLMINYKF